MACECSSLKGLISMKSHHADHISLRGFDFSALAVFLVPIMVLSGAETRAQEAQSRVSQTVTIEVRPIARIAVSGSPRPLLIDDASTELNALSVTDVSTRYSLVTNQDNMKIVAAINHKMPSGTRLMIALTSSRGASMGMVNVSEASTPVDVVTGLSRTSDLNQSISYTFAIDPDISDIPTQSRDVTLTLTN